jgi:hypothetical protein
MRIIGADWAVWFAERRQKKQDKASSNRATPSRASRTLKKHLSFLSATPSKQQAFQVSDNQIMRDSVQVMPIINTMIDDDSSSGRENHQANSLIERIDATPIKSRAVADDHSNDNSCNQQQQQQQQAHVDVDAGAGATPRKRATTAGLLLERFRKKDSATATNKFVEW